MNLQNRTVEIKFINRSFGKIFAVIAVTGMVIASASPASAQTNHNWTNPVGGLFNTGTNWSLAPTFAPGADETLNFGSFLNGTNVNGYTATAATGFTRVINFNNQWGAQQISIATIGLTFNTAGGLTPQLNQNGFGLANIGAFTMNNSMTIGGTGAGNLTVTGGITNNAGGTGNGLTINQTGGGFSDTGAVIIFNSAGTWGTTATTTINGGNVAVRSSTALGGVAANTITFNAGSFRFSASGLTLANNFVLNNTMTVGYSTGTEGTNTISGIMSGTGGLQISPVTGMALTLTGANTFTGDVVYAGINNTTTFGLHLSGANGSIANTNNITISSNGALTLDNATAPSLARLNASATVNLNSAKLLHWGNSAVATSTTFGTLNSVGQSLITVSPGSGSPTGGGSTLTIGTWNRTANATANITAANLGNAPAANTGTIVLTNNPGGAVGGILPFAIANTSTTTGVPVNTFVRYDAGTSRLVGLSHTTDYQGGLPATQVMELYRNPVTTANYRATVTQAGLGNTTVNSLILDSTPGTAPFLGVSISGSGTLNVTTGAILSSVTIQPTPIRNTIAVNTLNFGANTGYIHTAGANSTVFVDLNISSTITGTGGLVKSGSGTLVLAGNNTFSGDLYINSGLVSITTDANLGAAGNAVRLNSGNRNGLIFNPTNLFSHGSQTTLFTSRNFIIGDSGGSINVNNFNNTMTLSGTVSGTGFLFKGGAGTLVLTGINTYSGSTQLLSGVLNVQNDAALGAASGDLIFVQDGESVGGVLQAGSSFSTSRNVLTQSTAAQFFTNGNNLTLHGVIGTQNNVGLAGMTKLGTGDLVLTNTNTYNGATVIGGTGVVVPSELSNAQTGGRVVLSGANGSIALSTGITINPGSVLRLDNSAAVNNFRVGHVAVAMNSGALEVVGNSTTNSSTAIGPLTSTTFANTITLDQTTGTGSTTNALTVTSYTNPTTSQITFLRGSNLGATSGNRTAVMFNIAPTTVFAGILPSMVGSDSATGNPTEFLRLGTAVGGQTPVVIFSAYSANLPNAGAGSVANITSSLNLTAASTIGAARLTTGGNINMTDGATTFAWTIQSGSLISAGASNSITNSLGGTAVLTLGGTTTGGGTAAGFGRITNTGTLTIGSGVQIAATNVTKFGGGDLVLNNSVAASAINWNVAQGTLRYGTGVAGALPALATVNVAPGATLDLNGNSAVTLANITGFGNVNVGAGGLAIGFQTGGFAGNVSGTGAMNLNHATQSITVSGNSSGFTGGWNVNGGTLTLQSTNGLGSGQIRIGNTSGTAGATFQISSVAPTSIANNILVANGSTGLMSLEYATNTNGTFTGNVNIANTAAVGLRLTSPLSSTVINPGSWTLAGDISGVGNVHWFGGNWNLWGNNAGWSGNLSVDNAPAMQLGIGSDTALGTGTLTWSSAKGGMIRADNGARTLANNIVVNASSTAFSVSGVNDLTLNGTVLLNTAGGAHNINVINTGTTTLGGIISGANSTSSMSQSGSGTLILSGANTFAGGYGLNSGVLGLGNDSALGVGTLTVSEGGILRATGGARTIANGVTVGGNFGVDGSNALTMNGNMALGSVIRTVVVNNTANTTFGGIIGGTGGLTKAGTGDLILAGSSTYTGNTLISTGRLIVGGSLNSGPIATFNISSGATGRINGTLTTGSLTVNSGGLLDGIGTINTSLVAGVTVNGTLAAGNSIGTLTVAGNLTLNGTNDWEVISGGTFADITVVNGNLTLGSGSMLNLIQLGTFTSNQKFTVMAYSGMLNGAFSNGGSLTGWTINYADAFAGLNGTGGGGTNFITLMSVPEVGTLIPLGSLGLASAIAVSWNRRRRKRIFDGL